MTDQYPSNKLKAHESLCSAIHDLYIRKNKAYGDSFGDTYQKLGIISAVTRITDKYNRLVNLAVNKEIPCGDESIKDTLLDLANYCLMTVIEAERENETNQAMAYTE